MILGQLRTGLSGPRRLIADAGETWPYIDDCWFFRPVYHISQFVGIDLDRAGSTNGGPGNLGTPYASCQAGQARLT